MSGPFLQINGDWVDTTTVSRVRPCVAFGREVIRVLCPGGDVDVPVPEGAESAAFAEDLVQQITVVRGEWEVNIIAAGRLRRA